MDDVFGKARDKKVGTNAVSHGAFVPIFDAGCQNGKTFPLDQSGSGQDNIYIVLKTNSPTFSISGDLRTCAFDPGKKPWL